MEIKRAKDVKLSFVLGQILNNYTLIRSVEHAMIQNLELKGSWVDLGSGKSLSSEYDHLNHDNAKITLCDIDSNDESSVRQVNLENNLPFSDEEFDGVMLCHTAQYIYNIDQLFKEINRITKRYLIVIMPYSLNYAPEVGVDYARYRSDYLNKKLDDCGFKEINIHPIFVGPFSNSFSVLEPFIRNRSIKSIFVLFSWLIDKLILGAVSHRKRAAIIDRSVLGYICIAKKDYF